MNWTKKIIILTILILISAIAYMLSTKDSNTPASLNTEKAKSSNLLPWPIDKAEQRQKLLKFGMYVTPDPNQNPISPPERFTGYHTGLDIEILPEELNAPVPVKTICEGKILYSGIIEGYGGVVIQECNINNEPTSVLYGHLKQSSINVREGQDIVKQGNTVAELGDHKTEETGNTRKHLHLGIHKGNHVEFLGYLTDPKDLEQFIDPLPLLQE